MSRAPATPERAAAAARELVVGTRGSALAVTQTTLVCDALRRIHPALSIRVERIRTTGDARQDVSLTQLGRGVFVKEIEAALLDRRIDIAVHSAKDLPSTLASEFALGAILARADARDVLVSPHGTLRTLPRGARVATSSPRRAFELRAIRPDLEPVQVRGNVDTRLSKLANGEFEALILAAAGLIRLGRAGEITEFLDPDVFIPSVGQGALAIETRADDPRALELVRVLDDASTRAAVLAERAFLAELGAGCRAPAGAHARVEAGDTLRIAAFIGGPAGDEVRAARTGSAAHPRAAGVALAHELIARGGARFLATGEGALAGKVIAVTRPADRSVELIELLRAHGAIPIVCPTIAVERLTELPELDRALFTGGLPRWIAFTSVNAVDAVADRLDAVARRLPDSVRIAAVGNATAEAVERRFRAPDFVSAGSNAAALASELPGVAGGTVLFPRGDLAADTLASGLAARGATVRDVVVYRTTAGPGAGELAACARAGRLDAVIFASPSSVHFAGAAAEAIAGSGDSRPVVVCIGATTARAARALGLEPVESASASVGGIVESLVDHLGAPAIEVAASAPGSD